MAKSYALFPVCPAGCKTSSYANGRCFNTMAHPKPLKLEPVAPKASKASQNLGFGPVSKTVKPERSDERFKFTVWYAHDPLWATRQA